MPAEGTLPQERQQESRKNDRPTPSQGGVPLQVPGTSAESLKDVKVPQKPKQTQKVGVASSSQPATVLLDDETSRTRHAIKQILFCVPCGWLEDSTPSDEQVAKDKNFVCKARTELDSEEKETHESGHTQLVRKFFEDLTDLDSTGRQVNSRISVEETGTIVLRLRVNNKEIDLDFAPNSKSHKMLLECVDCLVLALFGNNSGRVFLGGTFPGSLCVLLRAPNPMLDHFLVRWPPIDDQLITLGNDFSLLGIYCVFSATRMLAAKSPPTKIARVEKHTTKPESLCHLKSTMEEVLDGFLDATNDGKCNADSGRVEFMACTIDDGDDFFFLMPENKHSMDMFFSNDSDCWFPVHAGAGSARNVSSLLAASFTPAEPSNHAQHMSREPIVSQHANLVIQSEDLNAPCEVLAAGQAAIPPVSAASRQIKEKIGTFDDVCDYELGDSDDELGDSDDELLPRTFARKHGEADKTEQATWHSQWSENVPRVANWARKFKELAQEKALAAKRK